MLCIIINTFTLKVVCHCAYMPIRNAQAQRTRHSSLGSVDFGSYHSSPDLCLLLLLCLDPEAPLCSGSSLLQPSTRETEARESP